MQEQQAKTTDPDLIDQAVRWRMRQAYDAPLLDWRSPHCLFERNNVLQYAQIGCFLITPNEISMHAPRSAPFIDPWKIHSLTEYHALLAQLHPHFSDDIQALGAHSLALIGHVQDGNVFPFAEPHPREDRAIVATLAPNRPVRRRSDRSEMVLLPRRHLFNRAYSPSTSPVPWENRKTGIFWRGQITGMRYDYGIDDDIALESLRKPYSFASDVLLQAMKSGRFNGVESLRGYQRLRAAIDYAGHPDIDIAMTEATDERQIALAPFTNDAAGIEIFKPRLSQAEYDAVLAGYKIRLAIPGNDVASSLAGDLLSDAAVMMPDPFHETEVHFGLEPGRHYVPLKPDMSDLPEQLSWCRENDDQLREIALEGQRHAVKILDKAFGLEVARRIFVRLAQNMQGAPQV